MENEALKQALARRLREVVTSARKLLTKAKLGFQHIAELNSVGLLAFDAIDSLSVAPEDRAILERTLQEIHDKLQLDAYLHFFASFYNLPKTVYQGDIQKVQELLGKTNLDVTTMRVRIRAAKLAPFSMDDSIDRTFFERMKEYFIRGARNLIQNLPEAISPLIYSLLNVHQTLVEYLDAGFPEFKSEALDMLKETRSLVEQTLSVPDGRKALEQSAQLQMFVAAQMRESDRILGLKTTITPPSIDVFQDSAIRQRLYGHLSLEAIDRGAFAKSFGTEFPRLLADTPKQFVPLLLSLVTRKLRHDNDNSIDQELELSVDWPSNDWFVLEEYIQGYDKISQVKVTPDEIGRVAELDDTQLRKMIARLVRKVDEVATSRESKKPHGPAEIGDMDLPFRRKGEDHFLSLVVKSGREVKGVLGEQVMGQVVRPFIHLGDKCIVVLLTARRCSQNLLSGIKRASTRFNQRIFVIQEAELAALLKVNNLI